MTILLHNTKKMEDKTPIKRTVAVQGTVARFKGIVHPAAYRGVGAGKCAAGLVVVHKLRPQQAPVHRSLTVPAADPGKKEVRNPGRQRDVCVREGGGRESESERERERERKREMRCREREIRCRGRYDVEGDTM